MIEIIPAQSSRAPKPGRLALAGATLLSAVIAACLWIYFDRPVPLAEGWSQPLSSVSFAPFRRGQSPLTKVYPTPEQVESDLQSLVGKARGVRTYTALEGMQVVPEMAAKLGLKVIYSAWLGSDKEAKGRAINERETEAVIKAANTHPDEIERIIVGNEVLLRNDLTPEKLIGFIRRVKAEVKQPVSYADVWAFYLKHPEVGREVDFITIHILPFWEDEPVDIDHVEPHVVEIVNRIRQAFPGKPILIGEAGWPSLGRDRGPAHVSTVNEARFVRKMAALAAQEGFDYNIVEAFDQPWKSKLENTVGAAWGIMDVDRKAKFAMSGPVTEVADWRTRAAVAILGGMLATVFLGTGLPGIGRLCVFALAAQGLAWLGVTACFHAEAVSFRWWQDLWAPFRGGLAVVMAWQILNRCTHLLGRIGVSRSIFDERRWGGEVLTFFYGVYALVWTFLLVVDGRYRDIPVIDFGVPAAGMALLLALRIVRVQRDGTALLPALSLDGLFTQGAALPEPLRRRLVRWLGWGLPVAAAATLISEGLAIIGDDFVKFHPALSERIPLVLKAMVSNVEMNLWAVMLLALGLPHAVALLLRWRAGTEALREGRPVG